MADKNAPMRGLYAPRATVSRIYKEDHYTLLHTRPVGRIYVKGTVGRIFKEDHYTLLRTKYESSRPCGFREEDFLVIPMTPLGRGPYGP